MVGVDVIVAVETTDAADVIFLAIVLLIGVCLACSFLGFLARGFFVAVVDDGITSEIADVVALLLDFFYSYNIDEYETTFES